MLNSSNIDDDISNCFENQMKVIKPDANQTSTLQGGHRKALPRFLHASTIKATHLSNHTLNCLGLGVGRCCPSKLCHLDMSPLRMGLKSVAYAISWFDTLFPE